MKSVESSMENMKLVLKFSLQGCNCNEHFQPVDVMTI